jgi:putative NADPH-quinone reductase
MPVLAGSLLQKDMATKILIINGHPDPESFSAALSAAYQKGAFTSGHDVKTLNLRQLDFNPILTFGYRQRTESDRMEPDLLRAQELIKWADHLVWVFPVWWGSLPALLKGFLDRTFLPGYAFSYRENSIWWDKLLKGRTARVIQTLDQPPWFYRWINGRPTYHVMKKMVLGFCGVKRIRVTSFGPVKKSKAETREKWLRKVEGLGRKGV